MCGPTAILAVGMLVTAAAGAYSADASKKQGQYAKEVADQNAETADFQAEQAATIGSIQEERARAQSRLMVGKQRAMLAANGADLSSGSALDIVSETALFGEEDALMTRFNAMNESWGFRKQATDYRMQGDAALTAGKNQATGTYLSTAGSLLSMGSGLYGGAGSSAAKVPKVAGTSSTKSTFIGPR